MRKIPELFGCPLWYGKIKRNVAKRHINKWPIGFFVHNRRFYQLGVGNLINDCSGFNVEIANISPWYWRVGQGFVLRDITFTNTNSGSCSLTHCGVELPLSRDKIEANHVEFLENWTLGESGRRWYRGKEYDKMVEEARQTIALLKSGGHITNEKGCRLATVK